MNKILIRINEKNIINLNDLSYVNRQSDNCLMIGLVFGIPLNIYSNDKEELDIIFNKLVELLSKYDLKNIDDLLIVNSDD